MIQKIIRAIYFRFISLVVLVLLGFTGKATHDTTVIRQLLVDSKAVQWDNRELAFQRAYKAKALVAKVKFEYIRADFYQRMGNLHSLYNNPDSSIYYAGKALEYYKKVKDYDDMSACYNTLGSIYYGMGDHVRGLKNFLEALKISIDLKDSTMIAGLYNNIGNIYDHQADNATAIKYYRKAEELNLKSNNKNWLGLNYNNIALVFQEEKRYPEALEYFKKSHALQKELNDEYSLALAATNMANCYNHLDLPDSSNKYYRQGWALYKKLNVPEGIIRCKVNLANAYMRANKPDSALILAKQSLAEAEKIHSPNIRLSAYEILAYVYNKKRDFENAFKNYQAYVALKDSVSGTERIAETARTETAFKFRQQQQQDSLRHEQEKFEQALITGQREEKQKYIRYSLLAVIALLAAFGVYVFVNFKRKTRLSNELRLQKEIVEEKNSEITQSIVYAKRIQDALLPDEKFLDQHFSSSFIMFKPKDIVSGDFYWFREKDGYIQVVLADCTGHGVPGAMMSVMGHTFLNESADETSPDEPHRMLEVLDKKVLVALRSKGATANDGMDCIAIHFHLASRTAYIASAKRPLIIVSGGEVAEIAGSRFSIGGADNMQKTFGLVTTRIQKGDAFYLFTDGITDQFGGQKGKKLKYANFRNVISSKLDIPLGEQHQLLADAFEQWKGKFEQTDDVSVIGIRI